ncbi:MAG: hypothetical protein IJJ29_12375, partial [Solobacterium sp.]|nr:hypothetical protein [Solobacterium sp.]
MSEILETYSKPGISPGIDPDMRSVADLLADQAERKGLRIDPAYDPYNWEKLHSIYSGIPEHIRKESGIQNKPVFIAGSYSECKVFEALGYTAAEYRADLLQSFIEDLKTIPVKAPLIICLRRYQERAALELCKALQRIRAEFYKIDLFGSCTSAAEYYRSDPERFKQDLARICEDPRKADYLQGSAAGSVPAFVRRIQQSRNSPPISTGFAHIDSTLGGGMRPQLITLLALSNVGKSALCLQIADQIAEYTGHDVMYVTLEMNKYEHIARSISRETFIYADKSRDKNSPALSQLEVLDGSYSPEQQTAVEHARNKYLQYANHIYFVEGSQINVEQIRSRADLHRAITGKAPVIIVDYLQILAPLNQSQDQRASTDRNVTELKDISNQYNIPVILISSINRSS